MDGSPTLLPTSSSHVVGDYESEGLKGQGSTESQTSEGLWAENDRASTRS